MAKTENLTYTVRNTSLDEIFTKFGISGTDEIFKMDEDKLLDLLRDAKVLAVYEPTKKTSGAMQDYRGAAGPKFKLVTHLSIERLIKESTVEIFMPLDYWRSEHKMIARERDIYERLDKASTGQETV